MPHTFALSMISGRKAKSLSLRAFSTGVIRTRGEAVSSMKSYHANVRLDVPAFLVQHSSRGYVVFDTGLSPVDSERPLRVLDRVSPYSFLYKQKKGRDLLSQLRAAGIQPEEVRTVVLSRLDYEAAGMAAAFSSATVVVSRAERDSCAGSGQSGRRACPAGLATLEEAGRLRALDLDNAPSMAAFENAVDLFDDGSLYLVSLPGRTPGNMGAWLNLDEGPVLLTGGACFVVDNYLDLALPVKGMVADLTDYWRTLHIIRVMRRAVPRLLVVPGNELGVLQLIRRPDIAPPDARGR